MEGWRQNKETITMTCTRAKNVSDVVVAVAVDVDVGSIKEPRVPPTTLRWVSLLGPLKVGLMVCWEKINHLHY